MKSPKFTTAKNYVVHRGTTNRRTNKKLTQYCAHCPIIYVNYKLKCLAAENIQTLKKELRAVKTEQPPTVDGVLDDACWQDAPQATGFIDERTGELRKVNLLVVSFIQIKPSISAFISMTIA